MRIVLPIVGAIIGLFVGLVLGGIAALCFVGIVLSATGHPDPVATIDAAFASRPMGWPALIVITTYLASALLGAAWLYRMARRFALRLPQSPCQHRVAQTAEMLARWRAVSRARKAVLIALLVLTAAVGGPNFFYYQRTLEQASRVPTTERPVSINDHGQELYVTVAQKRLIGGWSFAMFVLSFGTLGYAINVFRCSELFASVFRTRETNDGNA